MRKYKKVTIQSDVIDKVQCNKCAKILEISDDNIFEQNSFHNFLLSFAYGSGFDSEKWSFDLCENCLVDIVKEFNIVPSGFGIDSYSVIEDESTEHQKIFEDWRKEGEWDVLKYKSYEELVELSAVFRNEYINEFIKKYHPDKSLI